MAELGWEGVRHPHPVPKTGERWAFELGQSLQNQAAGPFEMGQCQPVGTGDSQPNQLFVGVSGVSGLHLAQVAVERVRG